MDGICEFDVLFFIVVDGSKNRFSHANSGIVFFLHHVRTRNFFYRRKLLYVRFILTFAKVKLTPKSYLS
jgi:hypothetical protein